MNERSEHADISNREVIVPIAERFGISASDVETAWHKRRFSPTVDAFIEDELKVGVRGVPAMGWPNRRAIVGLMPFRQPSSCFDFTTRRRNGYAVDRCDSAPELRDSATQTAELLNLVVVRSYSH